MTLFVCNNFILTLKAIPSIPLHSFLSLIFSANSFIVFFTLKHYYTINIGGNLKNFFIVESGCESTQCDMYLWIFLFISFMQDIVGSMKVRSGIANPTKSYLSFNTFFIVSSNEIFNIDASKILDKIIFFLMMNINIPRLKIHVIQMKSDGIFL